jgi:hypothetical protein
MVDSYTLYEGWRLLLLLLLLLLFILTANEFLSGGSGTTIRHNTQITHIIQNNTTIKRNTAHKSTHTIHTLHKMNKLSLEYNNHNYHKVALINISMLYTSVSSDLKTLEDIRPQ